MALPLSQIHANLFFVRFLCQIPARCARPELHLGLPVLRPSSHVLLWRADTGGRALFFCIGVRCAVRDFQLGVSVAIAYDAC